MPRTQFQDTFTKTEGDKNLQYDDSAFYFFASSILFLFGVGLLISIYRQFKAKQKIKHENHKICNCQKCTSKITDLIKFRKHSSSFYFKIFLLIIVLFLAHQSASKASSSKGFKGFDPWEIMDLLPNTPLEDIKRKYKQLALKLHPDKNSDEDAVQKLILLNKAYTCLTNPEAAANCGNFGNPDGNSGAFEVGIALPSFLLKKKNRLVILALFFILILIVLPLLVLYLYQNSDNLDKNGINTLFLGRAIECFKNDNVLFKNFIEIIVQAEEMSPFLSAHSHQIKDLESLRDPDFQPKIGELKFRPFLKPFYLLHAYMTKQSIPKSLEKDLFEILKVSYRLIDSLFEFSIGFYLNKQWAQRVLGKELSFNIIERLVMFTQHFYQGLWLHDSSLLQLPNFNKQNIEQIKRKLKKIESLRDFRKSEDALSALEKIFAKDEVDVQEDIQALDCISSFKIECQVLVENSDNPVNVVFIGDVFTIKIDILRLNKNIGFAHSNKFPFLKRETVLLMIFDNTSKSPIDYRKITSLDTVLTTELKDQARGPGFFDLKIMVKSDCYLDVDEEINFEFLIKARPYQKQELHVLHPDDEKALQESSFMKSLLDDVKGKEIDSDEELEENEQIDEKVEEEQEEIKEDKF